MASSERTTSPSSLPGTGARASHPDERLLESHAAMTRRPPPKRYDRAYFDRWYRDAGTRVHRRAMVQRKVAFAVAAAEQLLDRRIRSVLDVGCGEAPWQPLLQRLRPGIRYAGIDSSPYSVERFGLRRNVRLGTFGRLGELGL